MKNLFKSYTVLNNIIKIKIDYNNNNILRFKYKNINNNTQQSKHITKKVKCDNIDINMNETYKALTTIFALTKKLSSVNKIKSLLKEGKNSTIIDYTFNNQQIDFKLIIDLINNYFEFNKSIDKFDKFHCLFDNMIKNKNIQSEFVNLFVYLNEIGVFNVYIFNYVITKKLILNEFDKYINNNVKKDSKIACTIFKFIKQLVYLDTKLLTNIDIHRNMLYLSNSAYIDNNCLNSKENNIVLYLTKYYDYKFMIINCFLELSKKLNDLNYLSELDNLTYNIICNNKIIDIYTNYSNELSIYNTYNLLTRYINFVKTFKCNIFYDENSNYLEIKSLENKNILKNLMYNNSYKTINLLNVNYKYVIEYIDEINIVIYNNLRFVEEKYVSNFIRKIYSNIYNNNKTFYNIVFKNINTNKISKYHKNVIKILNFKKVNYINEYYIEGFYVDIFIKPNLIIEINGDDHFYLKSNYLLYKYKFKELMLLNLGYNILNINYYDYNDYNSISTKLSNALKNII